MLVSGLATGCVANTTDDEDVGEYSDGISEAQSFETGTAGFADFGQEEGEPEPQPWIDPNSLVAEPEPQPWEWGEVDDDLNETSGGPKPIDENHRTSAHGGGPWFPGDDRSQDDGEPDPQPWANGNASLR